MRAPPTRWLEFAVFVVAMLPFLPALPFDFMVGWDDDRYVLQNSWLGGPGFPNLLGVFLQPYYFNYHPLTMVSFQLEYVLWGAWAPGMRATNIVLHGLTAVATAWCLRLFGAGPVAAALGATLFAIHPLRVESVVWISERKDVLCGLFFVLALGCWKKAAAEGSKEFRWIFLSILAWFCALLSKAAAIPFAAIVVLHDALLNPDRLRARLPIYTGLFALAVLFALINMSAQEHALNVAIPLAERLWMAFYAPAHYLGGTVWPIGLSGLYPLEFRPSAEWSGRVIGLFICTISLGAVVYTSRRSPLVAFALLAAALMLGPVSGIVGFGAAWAADRYSYLPTILLLCGFVPIAERAVERREVAGSVLIASLVLAALLVTQSVRDLDRWSTPRAFWSHVLERFPESLEARRNLATAIAREADSAQDAAEAAALWREALSVFPANGTALLRHAEALLDIGAEDELRRLLDEALAVRGIVESTRRWALVERGIQARRLGDEESAVTDFEAALLPPPVHLPTVQDLLFVAWHAERADRFDVAFALYTETLRREPRQVEAMQGLAILYARLGRFDEAIPLMRRASAFRPSDEDLAANLATMERQAVPP